MTKPALDSRRSWHLLSDNQAQCSDSSLSKHSCAGVSQLAAHAPRASVAAAADIAMAHDANAADEVSAAPRSSASAARPSSEASGVLFSTAASGPLASLLLRFRPGGRTDALAQELASFLARGGDRLTLVPCCASDPLPTPPRLSRSISPSTRRRWPCGWLRTRPRCSASASRDSR